MKQNQIEDLPKLNSSNYENIFNVYQDENGRYFYNLLQSIVFPSNLPQNLFSTYITKYGDTWPYISFKTLDDPNLWWIILLANNIVNPTEKMIPGVPIKIPVIQVVQEVLGQIGRS